MSSPNPCHRFFPCATGWRATGGRILGLALACALFFVSAAQGGEEITVDGVLHVRNGATPGDGVETLNLQELWRAGGEDDEVFFGVINRVLTDAGGNIYLLDSQLSEVQVYSADGEYLRTLSREGDGPGETRNPQDMLFLPDGTLGLVQQFPGKIVKIDLEGNPAGALTPGKQDPTQGGFQALVDAHSSGDNIVIGGLSISMDQAAGRQDRTSYVASFDSEAKELTRYHSHQYSWDFSALKLVESDLLYMWRRWSIDNQGRVLLPTERNQYAISIFNPGGSLDRVFEREFKSWQRLEDEGNFASSIMDAISSQIPFDIERDIEDTDPDIASIHTAADGSIWVLSSRGNRNQAEGVMVTYDVFDARGHFRKQVAVVCEGDGVNDALLFFGEDRVLLVTGFLDAIRMQLGGGGATDESEDEEAAPMEVICYRYDRLVLGSR